MTESHNASQQPPSYDSCIASASANSLQEPVLLVLAGQSIHAGSATGAPLYETNRGVANLGHATTCVELTRVERRVDSSSSAEAEEDAKEFGAADDDDEALVTPRVKVRRRHIMDLVHPTGKGGTTTSMAEAAAGTPPYYAKPWTKQTHQGIWGLKKARGRNRWQVLPVLEKARYGEPKYDDEGAVLFRVVKNDEGYEWRDEKDERLAVEEQGEEDKEHRLRTMKGLDKDMMDVLVAMWCCRIWEEAAAAQPPIHEGLEKVRRRLRLAKEFPGTSGVTLGIGAAAVF